MVSANAAHTTRRTLFAIAAGAALAPATLAIAGPRIDRDPEWDGFTRTMALIHPRLVHEAGKARSEGFRPGDCRLMHCDDSAGCMIFQSPELGNRMFQWGAAAP